MPINYIAFVSKRIHIALLFFPKSEIKNFLLTLYPVIIFLFTFRIQHNLIHLI